jgi:hypothetical protein
VMTCGGLCDSEPGRRQADTIQHLLNIHTIQRYMER